MRKPGLQAILPLAWVVLAVGLIFFFAYPPGNGSDMPAAEAQSAHQLANRSKGWAVKERDEPGTQLSELFASGR